jgi:hypothetical protein
MSLKRDGYDRMSLRTGREYQILEAILALPAIGRAKIVASLLASLDPCYARRNGRWAVKS